MAESYGRQVARARDEMGLTQEQFAAKVGIPKRTLQDIELDKVARPQRATREAIDRVIGAGPAAAAREGWPADVQVFLDVMGAFLSRLPEDRRLAFIHEETRRIVTQMGQS